MRLAKKLAGAVLILLLTGLLSGCILRTTDEMYCLPRRSAENTDLQAAIDAVMPGLTYCAPSFGENQQTVQMADLDGDGNDEAVLFAKSDGPNPLKIFVFRKTSGGYENIAKLESAGSAYEQAEYVQLDGQGGLELVVGRLVGEGVPHSLAVYTFPEGEAKLMMTTNYSRFLTADLNGDGQRELFVLSQDEETGRGVAELYYYGADGIERSTEASMSVAADQVRRIATGGMCRDTQAVFVASVYDEKTIITDVFALLGNHLTNVSLSNESGTSVETIRNYYVYADDIDGDGLIELPSLIPLGSVEGQAGGENQNLIRWYNLDRQGGEHVKLTTYHNYTDGWYLTLEDNWGQSVDVLRSGEGSNGKTFVFGLWNEQGTMEKLFTIYAFSGEDREDRSRAAGLTEIARKAEVIYCVGLGTGPDAEGIRAEDVAQNFHFIQIAWKTGET